MYLIKDILYIVRTYPSLFIILSFDFNRITITTKGKYTAINEGKAIQPLVELVDDPVSEVRLNAIKVSTL